MQQLQVGLIGTGLISGSHIEGIKGCVNAHLAAICGRDRQKAERIASENGIAQVYTDYRKMLECAKLDAVIVAGPDDLHCQMTLDALDAGLHVLCEKPLAPNAIDARRMFKAAVRTRRINMACFNRRFYPATRHIKELLNQGAIGRVFTTQMAWEIGVARIITEQKISFRALPGWTGTWGDLGPHLVDLLRFFFGDVRRVHAHLGRFVQEHASDYAAVSLEFGEGVLAQLNVSALAPRGISFTITGSIATLESQGDPPEVSMLKPTGPFSAERIPLGVPERLSSTPNLHQHFVEAILNDTKNECDFYDGYKVQEVIDSAFESHRRGIWIECQDMSSV